ncbi:MAG: HIT domain-containing protein [Alphaproteobacteria bacterium]|nr:HIT domain-containing protein [Alphaproteobacteria bacterium]
MTDFKERFVSKETAKTHKSYLAERANGYNAQNPFSKILRGEMAARIINETPYAVIIQNQTLRTNVYNLALPIYPAGDLFDFAEHATADMSIGYANAIRDVVRNIYQTNQSLNNCLKTSCARIVFNFGPNSQNTVPHLHAHIMADENLVNAQHLILSQKSAEELDAWAKEQENPSIDAYERIIYDKVETATHLENSCNANIKLLKDGQKLGWKENAELNNPTRESLFDLIHFLRIVATFTSTQEHWGGRAIIDINHQGNITTHASGGVLLRKLPLTPLTQHQLTTMIQNIHT